jgi:hypothetical protein
MTKDSVVHLDRPQMTMGGVYAASSGHLFVASHSAFHHRSRGCIRVNQVK